MVRGLFVIPLPSLFFNAALSFGDWGGGVWWGLFFVFLFSVFIFFVCWLFLGLPLDL